MSFGNQGKYPNYGSTGLKDNSGGLNRGQEPSFNQLSDTISSNIFAINNSATSLDRAQKQLGTKTDSSSFRDRIHATQQLANETVSDTTICLKQLSELVEKGNKQQKLQLERLKNEFKDTVQRYSSVQKLVATKMKYTLLNVMPNPIHPTVEWGIEDDNEENQALLEEEKQRMQKQKQLDSELEVEQALLEEREQRIREIESDMLDVNQIFRDLASMVHEQGEVINTIADNIDNTCYNVEEGASQLQKASEYQVTILTSKCIITNNWTTQESNSSDHFSPFTRLTEPKSSENFSQLTGLMESNNSDHFSLFNGLM
ncbi:syntaxin-12-like isoform X2 [Limulus polyphemus]|uniref:Syntaxin-12-like isoform X2 n=1 Tax=Limulus polyphemus TaxID=6850 RepID=A0ABM1S0D3_LIMPO|nr:syntaxin-12-like isoform X2 [Limulus polyphemus]